MGEKEFDMYYCKDYEKNFNPSADKLPKKKRNCFYCNFFLLR